MQHIHAISIAALAAAVVVAACRESQPRTTDTVATTSSCDEDARRVVEDLGRRMRMVSLLAPDSVVARSIRDAYASLATPELLAQWQQSPRQAPGREVSSPWPARIAVSNMQPDARGCRVTGEIAYVTNADTMAVVERRPAVLRVVDDSGRRVSSYESPNPPPVTAADSTQPADVVRRYYAAIDAKDFASAYALWGQDGQASGKTLQQFATGFGNTTRSHVTIGDSGRVEGAAGSQYATVPVTVDATLRGGREQHFTGTYTLRRAMVDGATAAQRRWHIYRAELRER